MDGQYDSPNSAVRSRAWNVVRLPLLLFLTFLAPIVDRVCAALFLIGVVSSIAFETSAVGPRFPFGVMLAASFGFLIFLVAYHAAIEALTR